MLDVLECRRKIRFNKEIVLKRGREKEKAKKERNSNKSLLIGFGIWELSSAQLNLLCSYLPH